MKLKNEIFASALDWLVANKKVGGQKSLALATGISENTISRIMTGKVEPSDDTLRRLSDKYGFNMAWLRGIDSDNMFLDNNTHDNEPSAIDNSFLHEKAIQKIISPIYDELISNLKKQVTDKDKQLARYEKEMDAKDDEIKRLHVRIQQLEAENNIIRNGDPLKDYPFHIGTAEDRDQPRL